MIGECAARCCDHICAQLLSISALSPPPLCYHFHTWSMTDCTQENVSPKAPNLNIPSHICLEYGLLVAYYTIISPIQIDKCPWWSYVYCTLTVIVQQSALSDSPWDKTKTVNITTDILVLLLAIWSLVCTWMGDHLGIWNATDMMIWDYVKATRDPITVKPL